MRIVNFILTAAFAASLLLAVSSLLGGMAPPSPQEKRGVSQRMSGLPARKAAGESAPAAFPKIRLAQATPVPEPAVNAPAKDAIGHDAGPASQKPFDTAVTASPSEAQQNMVRVAATQDSQLRASRKFRLSRKKLRRGLCSAP